MEVRGAVCLVTGASGGIGRATALALARSGARVIVHGRDRTALQDVVETIDGVAISADLADAAEVDRTAAEAQSAFGRVDVLVNNAAEGWAGRFADMDVARAEGILRVNLLAPIRLTARLLPPMLERDSGHVVNIASVAGHVGVADEAVYAAAKGGLITFSESLRFDLWGSGVGVTVVSPGIVDTAFFERRGRPNDRRIPRPVSPDRVAAAIVRGIERDRPQVFVPRWLAFPPWLRGVLPGLYRRLQARLG